MPNIQEYTQQNTAQGALGVRDANAADFGGQIGQAVGNIGAGVGEVANQSFKVEQDNGRIWAANMASNLHLNAQKDLIQRMQTVDPRDPNFNQFAENFTQDITDQGNDLMAQAPSKSAAKFLSSHIGTLRDQMFTHAATFQAHVTGEYSKELYTQGVSADADSVTLDPSNENFQQVLNRRKDMIEGLQTDGLNKMKFSASAAHDIGYRQVLTAFVNNPQQALQEINVQGGTFTKGTLRGGVPGGPDGFPNVSDIQGTMDPSQFGKRPDGSAKGAGFLGQLKRPDGGVSTEISISTDAIGGKDFPLLVPTLSRKEVDQILAVPTDDPNFFQKIPQSAIEKAQAYAEKRVAAGKSPFAEAQESPRMGQSASFSSAIGFVLSQEGGYKATDGNTNNPVNFGINQKYNPDVDVKNLTKESATQIYKDRYWDKIGGDSLPPDVAKVAMDAAVNQGVDYAKQLLKDSGGDVNKMIDLRQARYMETAKDPSQAGNLQGWTNRLNNLRSAVSGDNAAGVIASSGSIGVQPLNDGAILKGQSTLEGWKYLSPAEKITVVRQAEATMGRAAAENRSNLERRLKDVNAALLDGKVPPDINSPDYSRDNLIRAYGTDVGNRAADAFDYQKKVGNFMGQVATMPTEQVQATLKTLEPQAGEGYAEKSPVYGAAVRAAQLIDKNRSENPMQYALNNNLNDVKPLNFSDTNAMVSELKNRGSASSNMQKNYGTAQQIFTKDEANGLTSRLSQLAPKDKIGMLSSIRLAFGNDAQGQQQFQTAMSQISSKTPMAAYVGNLTSKIGMVKVNGENTDADTIARDILEGEYILQGKDLKDPTQTAKPMEMDDKTLRVNFNDRMGNSFRNLDAQLGNKMSDQIYQATKSYLAAQAVHTGKDFKEISSDSSAMKEAITAVTGGAFKRNGDTLLMPWGTSVDKFQNEFNPRAQQALESAGLSGTKFDVLDAYKFDNVGDGKYAFRNGNGYLLGSDGRTVIVDFNKPYVSPRKPTAAYQDNTPGAANNPFAF